MNINCAICQEIYLPTSEVVVIPCGHLFHLDCINVWIGSYRSKSCPQCRHPVQEKDIIKIYFNIAEVKLSDSSSSRESLQLQLDGANFQIRLKEKDLQSKKEDIAKLKKQLKDLREMVRELENKQLSDKLLIVACKQQIRDLGSKDVELQKLRAENSTLIHELSLLEDIRNVVKQTSEEVSEKLKNYQDPKDLLIMISTLKKELSQQQIKKNNIRKELSEMYSKYKSLEIEREKDEQEKRIYINRLKEYDVHIKELKRQLSESKKLKEKEVTEIAETEKSPLLTKKRHHMQVDNDIKEQNVSKKDLLTKMYEKNKKDEDLDVPYVQPEQVLSNSKITLGLNNLNSKLSILNKKMRLNLNVDNYQPLPDEAFNGLGGHRNVDEFANCKYIPGRSKSSKRKKIAPLKNSFSNEKRILDKFLNLSNDE